MANCGKSYTCGGMFTSGPGESDWQACETHLADFPRFGVIYKAQVHASLVGDPMPATADECEAYLNRTQGLVGTGSVKVVDSDSKS